MRSDGMIAVVISGMVVTAYHVLQPPPEFGITPEMFDWSQGWMGRVFGFVLSTLVLALVIALAIQFARWLARLQDWT